MNKAHILAALFMGMLSAFLLSLLWLPLALGVQVCQYSEPNQVVALFEFGCVILAFGFTAVVFLKALRKGF